MFQEAIRRQRGKPFGAIKATNILKFWTPSVSVILGIGRAASPQDGVLDYSKENQDLNCRVICDSEISGPENVEIFKSIFLKGTSDPRGMASLGVNLNYLEVEFSSEQRDRVLLLADYVAGFCHAAAGDGQMAAHFLVSVRRAERLYRQLFKGGRMAQK